MFLTSTALADTWTVDDDGKADFDNIQAAVDAASNGDEIIVMPGTYTGSGDEVVNMLGKAVTLRSLYPNNPDVVAKTIIDGEGTRRGIICQNGEGSNTSIEGFTIIRGFTNGTYPANCGGGMSNINRSSPTLTNCTIKNNTAHGWGGGMFNDNSSPTLTNCTFTGNTAVYDGGGMYNWHSSSPTLENCTFENNTASYGGGMWNNYVAFPTLTDCTFTDNAATNGGGGMYNTTSSSPTLTDTTACGNTPDQIYGEFTDGGGNTIADECPIDCPDINGDGYVNVNDLLVVIDQWGLTDSPADLNQDGIVDVTDLLIVVGNWGPCP